jgi:hypothetical protein
MVRLGLPEMMERLVLKVLWEYRETKVILEPTVHQDPLEQ